MIQLYHDKGILSIGRMGNFPTSFDKSAYKSLSDLTKAHEVTPAMTADAASWYNSHMTELAFALTLLLLLLAVLVAYERGRR